MSRASIVLGALALWTATSGQALAVADRIYPNAANWTVEGVAVAGANVTNSFNIGADGVTTLDVDVNPGNDIAIQATWVIQDRSSGVPSDTKYSRTLNFTPSSLSAITFDPITECTVNNSSSTCTKTIGFDAPGEGSHTVVVALTGPGSPGPLVRRTLTINFNVVAAPEPEDIDTKMTVAKQCFLLNDGEVDLEATLETLDPGDGGAIDGAEVEFSLDTAPIEGTYDLLGSAFTNASGLATLPYNIDGLAVGDHVLQAYFDGDSPLNPSTGSNILGISYWFLGFGQPINGDGTSIFSGRTIPVKIRLDDANGDPVTTAAPRVQMQRLDLNLLPIGEVENATSVSAADTGNIMRYSPTDQQYIYNFDTSNLANASYRITVLLGDSAACSSGDSTVIVTILKKGKK
jgi:hypothetical protein